MPAKTSRRGRPKGSGLDDSGQLVAIAALIAQNPDLKPTTAIKSLGVSDPSTIRRLRDKYRKFQNTAEITTSETNTKLNNQPKKSVKSAERAKALSKVKTSTPKINAARQPRSPKPVSASASDAALGEPSSWLNSWTALGLQSLATTIDVQIAACRNFMLLPPVALAVSQQTTFNEFTISLYKKQKYPVVVF